MEGLHWEPVEGGPAAGPQGRSAIRRPRPCQAGAGGGGEPIRVTQEQLGALSGASRSTVAAVLAAEQRRGAIEIHRGSTVVRDRQAVARRAGVRIVEVDASPFT